MSSYEQRFFCPRFVFDMWKTVCSSPAVTGRSQTTTTVNSAFLVKTRPDILGDETF